MIHFDVVQAEVIGDLTFEVTFADGTSGKVKILPSHLYGVFAPLSDPKVFGQLYIEEGAVCWPGDIDLAPDAMHEAIRANGVMILS